MKLSLPTLESAADDAPIVRLVHQILLDAVTQGASDIHFEPYEKQYRIRMRQDGVLHEIPAPPLHLTSKIAARLKVMAQLDISLKRLPQDGRFKFPYSSNRTIDVRVSTCPTLFGEKVVLRLLDPNTPTIGIDALGYEETQQKQFLEALSKPEGMILVTGPTGSGKTVTLYTALHILNTPLVNISTVEDPIEMYIPGLNQVQTNPKAGLNFATALRAFLRQDPDILMVGEIRDLETAEIAIKAAQTGHLVLSTVHTNSACETLTRLIHLGIPLFHLATCINLIVSQRLVRCLCPQCKSPYQLPSQTLIDLGFSSSDALQSPLLFEAVGCEACYGGYNGRTAIFEVLLIDQKMQAFILKGNDAQKVASEAQQSGMITLRQAGLLKVKKGLTSLQEVLRVSKD